MSGLSPSVSVFGRSDVRRPGGISVHLLLTLPALLLAFAFALLAGQAVQATTQAQNAVDAAALAAAQTLVDDDVLRIRFGGSLPKNRTVMLGLYEDARENAQYYINKNPILGEGCALEPNTRNDLCGDIAFGSLSTPTSRTLETADVEQSFNNTLHLVNSVRVTIRRTSARKNPIRLVGGPFLSLTSHDLVRSATAYLDRDVIGFSPIYNKKIPLAPLALLSDPTGSNKLSWQHQVEKRQGGDNCNFVHDARQVSYGPGKGDGLHEMTVRLLAPRNQNGASTLKEANCSLLQIQASPDAVSPLQRIGIQLLQGISKDDLKSDRFGGKFILGENNTLVVPGMLVGPNPNSHSGRQLAETLAILRQLGEVRIWPLFAAIDQSDHMPIISGFVAARVVHVYPPRNGKGISFVLQPASISESSALTNTDRRGNNGIGIDNPYICKIRLVE